MGRWCDCGRKNNAVVPANAGTHTAESIDKARRLSSFAKRRPVVMGPRSRFAWPGRQPLFARQLRRVAAFLAARLEQEPGAALGLVDEKLEEARGAGILMVVAQLVGFTHRSRHVLVVFH